MAILDVQHIEKHFGDTPVLKDISFSLEEGQAVFDKLNSVVSQFLHGKLNYLGMIPQDAALDKAVRQQKTVSLLEPASKSAKAFEVLADNLMNGTHNQVLAKRGIVQMFSGFLQKRK